MASLNVFFNMLSFSEMCHFHALEKEMATHSSVLAWRIPGMGEPSVLPSMGSHRVGWIRGHREDPGAGRPPSVGAALINIRYGCDRQGPVGFARAPSFCAPFLRVFTGGVHVSGGVMPLHSGAPSHRKPGCCLH